MAIFWLTARKGSLGQNMRLAQVILSGCFIAVIGSPSGAWIAVEVGQPGRVDVRID